MKFFLLNCFLLVIKCTFNEPIKWKYSLKIEQDITNQNILLYHVDVAMNNGFALCKGLFNIFFRETLNIRNINQKNDCECDYDVKCEDECRCIHKCASDMILKCDCECDCECEYDCDCSNNCDCMFSVELKINCEKLFIFFKMPSEVDLEYFIKYAESLKLIESFLCLNKEKPQIFLEKESMYNNNNLKKLVLQYETCPVSILTALFKKDYVENNADLVVTIHLGTEINLLKVDDSEGKANNFQVHTLKEHVNHIYDTSYTDYKDIYSNVNNMIGRVDCLIDEVFCCKDNTNYINLMKIVRKSRKTLMDVKNILESNIIATNEMTKKGKKQSVTDSFDMNLYKLEYLNEISKYEHALSALRKSRLDLIIFLKYFC